MKDFVELIIIMLVAIPICLVMSLLSGYVFYLVWNRILVDVVTILAPITYWKSYFLALAISYGFSVSSYYRRNGGK